MKKLNIHCLIALGLLLVFICSQAVMAKGLPDLPKQELWIKVISILFGILVIFFISILGINRIIYSFGIEADNATKISIIIGVILSFLWFLYLFGQLFDKMITIALGVLIFVVILIFFLRSKGDGGDYDNDSYDDY